MNERSRVWLWRARRIDATWRRGIPLDAEQETRSPAVFREAVLRVAGPVLDGLARDEVSLRGLRGAVHIDADALVEQVVQDHGTRLDPTDGMALAIVKLQLALLEALDDALREDVLDDEALLDHEWTDERGLVDFL